jgi:hypothetical protein
MPLRSKLFNMFKICIFQRQRDEYLMARRKVIGEALDHALVTLAKLPALTGREPTIEDAKKAVLANTVQCGPIARIAEKYLHDNNIEGVKFHSLGGHYVLLDSTTGKLHDLECSAGCNTKNEILIWSREKSISDSPHLAREIIHKFELRWLDQRKKPDMTGFLLKNTKQ